MGKHSKTNEKVDVEVKKQKKANKKKKHIGLKIFIIILIILGICGGLFAKRVHDLDGNWLAALLGHNKETLKNLDKLEVLVVSDGSKDNAINIAKEYSKRLPDTFKIIEKENNNYFYNVICIFKKNKIFNVFNYWFMQNIYILRNNIYPLYRVLFRIKLFKNKIDFCTFGTFCEIYYPLFRVIFLLFSKLIFVFLHIFHYFTHYLGYFETGILLFQHYIFYLAIKNIF